MVVGDVFDDFESICHPQLKEWVSVVKVMGSGEMDKRAAEFVDALGPTMETTGESDHRGV